MLDEMKLILMCHFRNPPPRHFYSLLLTTSSLPCLKTAWSCKKGPKHRNRGRRVQQRTADNKVQSSRMWLTQKGNKNAWLQRESRKWKTNKKKKWRPNHEARREHVRTGEKTQESRRRTDKELWDSWEAGVRLGRCTGTQEGNTEHAGEQEVERDSKTQEDITSK